MYLILNFYNTKIVIDLSLFSLKLIEYNYYYIIIIKCILIWYFYYLICIDCINLYDRYDLFGFNIFFILLKLLFLLELIIIKSLLYYYNY